MNIDTEKGDINLSNKRDISGSKLPEEYFISKFFLDQLPDLPQSQESQDLNEDDYSSSENLAIEIEKLNHCVDESCRELKTWCQELDKIPSCFESFSLEVERTLLSQKNIISNTPLLVLAFYSMDPGVFDTDFESALSKSNSFSKALDKIEKDNNLKSTLKKFIEKSEKKVKEIYTVPLDIQCSMRDLLERKKNILSLENSKKFKDLLKGFDFLVRKLEDKIKEFELSLESKGHEINFLNNDIGELNKTSQENAQKLEGDLEDCKQNSEKNLKDRNKTIEDLQVKLEEVKLARIKDEEDNKRKSTLNYIYIFIWIGVGFFLSFLTNLFIFSRSKEKKKKRYKIV